MNYRTITANEDRISTLGLGGNIFGYTCDAKQTREILLNAETLGVNLVDTADVYSEGRSEEMIGKALEGRRNHWVIATKAGVRSDATGDGIGAKKLIFERIEHSLRRLRTDHIDIYQLHHFDPTTPVLETLEALETLRTQGKVKHFGLSNCTASQTRLYTVTANASGFLKPATNQIHYNLLKRKTKEEFLAQSHDHQPRLMIYGALGRGVLSGKYCTGATPDHHSRASMSAQVRADLQPAVLAAVADLAKIARSAGITMSQLAFAYTLRSTTVVAALIGIRNVAQLKEIAHTCSFKLSQNLWDTVDNALTAFGDLDNASLGLAPVPSKQFQDQGGETPPQQNRLKV